MIIVGGEFLVVNIFFISLQKFLYQDDSIDVSIDIFE